MTPGPVLDPVFDLPEGADADLNFYFVSDAKALISKITIQGVTSFASREDFLIETTKMLLDEVFASRACDWRLMMAEEVVSYRLSCVVEES